MGARHGKREGLREGRNQLQLLRGRGAVPAAGLCSWVTGSRPRGHLGFCFSSLWYFLVLIPIYLEGRFPASPRCTEGRVWRDLP